MKFIRFILVLSASTFILGSCSTDVDLYADYKDIPIIYGVLNPIVDTNYIKISHAFCGTNDDPINANEIVQIYDSSNYSVKLDARIIEMKSTNGSTYIPTGRILALDTITLHDKEEGIFYSPDQLFYYTTEPINMNKEREKYKYRLVVNMPSGDSLTAQTSVVGGEEFYIQTSGVGFQPDESNETGKIIFAADGVASLYEVSMQFAYREQLAGQEMKKKYVGRSFGTKTINDFTKVEGSTNLYYVEYSVNWLFNSLANAIGGDTIYDANHPNVVRYIDDFVITIGAASQDMALYYFANQAQLNSPMSLVTTYTNIEGGYGLFASRTKIDKVMKLSSRTKRELFGVDSWGFREQ